MRKIIVADNYDELKKMSENSVQVAYCDPPYFSNEIWRHVTEKGLNATYRESYSDKRCSFEIKPEQSIKIRAELAVETVISGIETIYGKDAANYTAFLAVRLIEIRRLLKDTGILWLQCDDNGGFIIKPLLDAVFRPVNNRGVVYWKRNNGIVKVTRTIPRQIDMVYRYSKHPKKYIWNKEAGYRNFRESEIEKAFDKEDAQGKYYLSLIHI